MSAVLVTGLGVKVTREVYGMDSRPRWHLSGLRGQNAAIQSCNLSLIMTLVHKAIYIVSAWPIRHKRLVADRWWSIPIACMVAAGEFCIDTAVGALRLTMTVYIGWRNKVPNICMRYSAKWSKWISAKAYDNQTSSNMCRNFRLEHFCISRDTNKIALYAIKQFLEAVHWLRCRSYTGYAKTSQ